MGATTHSNVGTIANAGTLSSTVTSAGTLTSIPTVSSGGTIASTTTITSPGTVAAVAAAQATLVYYVVADPKTGVISQRGHVPALNAAVALKTMGATEITAAQFEQVRRAVGRVALVNGQIVPIAAAAPNLTAMRANYNAKVDKGAEQARGQFITSGAGQALEYLATLAEAQKVEVAPDPLDATQYPWLSADVAAKAEAGNTTYTLRDAAQAAVAANAAWVAAGTTIKRVRLKAKASIAAATTQAQMQSVVAGLKWPSPG